MGQNLRNVIQMEMPDIYWASRQFMRQLYLFYSSLPLSFLSSAKGERESHFLGGQVAKGSEIVGEG